MRFVADTNIAQTVITNLRLLGHDVLDIKKQDPEMPDITEESVVLKSYES